MLKLADGGCILRWSEPQSGLFLEKPLDPREPVLGHKEHWQKVFLAMLERRLGAPG